MYASTRKGLFSVNGITFSLRVILKKFSMENTSNEFFGSVLVKSDIYKGVTIETNNLSLSDKEFEDTLSTSLNKWVKCGTRGIWFKVNTEKSSYIPFLVKYGFQFHHCKTSYVMLTRWLPGNEPNLLPQYPFTHIGVGGMVINNKNQVLTVQERYHERPHWKVPGGYSNPGEEFSDTAKREVFEETGIETEFVSVVALRHHHKHIFGCSDVYVVCHLRPKTDEIRVNDDEIAKCEWMDVETYRNHPDVTEFNKSVMESFLESQRLGVSIAATPILSYKKDCYNKLYNVKSIKDS